MVARRASTGSASCACNPVRQEAECTVNVRLTSHCIPAFVSRMALMGCHSAVATAKMLNRWMEEPTMYNMNAFMNNPLNGAFAMSIAFLLNSAELSEADIGDACGGTEARAPGSRHCSDQPV